MSKQINKKKKVFCKENIPNMLVILRMVMTIFIVACLIVNRYVSTFVVYRILDPFAPLEGGGYETYSRVTILILVAGILFVLASITDWLDGKLARKNNWVSDFGKFWDPIADKVLINSTLICFAWNDFIPVLIPIIMIVRDIIVDADRMVAAKQNIVVAANIYGKMKTVLQMLGIIFIFFLFCSNEYQDHVITYWAIQNLLMYGATIMSVFSGVYYMVQISKAKKEVKNAK